MNRYPRKPHHPQSGFSLVEILVALTLGLVLLGGTIVIYASSKNSYRLQENVAGMQENARFAIFALRRDLEMAGYPLVNDIAPFRIGGDDTGDNVNGGSDRVTIRYQSDTDCLGNETPDTGPDEGIAVNRYFIDVDNNLACLGNSDAPNQPLVENIDNMQILYGVDTDADGAANRYVSATQVEEGVISTGTPDWDRVVSLRVALLVASETAVDQPVAASGPSAPSISGPASEDFTLLDAPPITKDDGRLYRVFTTTIPLRNRTS